MALGLLGVSVLHLSISWKILAALLVDIISNNMQILLSYSETKFALISCMKEAVEKYWMTLGNQNH